MPTAVKQNLYQLFIYLLAITVWVHKFLIPKICPVLGSFFRAGNNITGGSNRGGGWTYYRSIKWSKKTNGIQRPSLGPPWPSKHSKVIENTIGELSVKSQHTITTKPWPFNGANLPLVALTGSEEGCYRNQTCQS